MFISLAGSWQFSAPQLDSQIVQLPGTLDTNHIGFPDQVAANVYPDEAEAVTESVTTPQESRITTRFTRRVTYEGAVVFSRRLIEELPSNKRLFFTVERARCLQVRVDGQAVVPFTPTTLSTRQLFEVTGLLQQGSLLEVISDNSYPGLPQAAIKYSSSATDETQTNWNGLLGEVGILVEEPVFISQLRVYPQQGNLKVVANIQSPTAEKAVALVCQSPLLEASQTQTVDLVAGKTEFTWEITSGELIAGYQPWDLEAGNLYPLTVTVKNATKTVSFGMRDFTVSESGHFALNGRRVFLRSEANCAVFPTTGHPPLDVDTWRKVLSVYRSYGVNCMRFHSWCPPEAAFVAADELGMLMQPELSHWDPQHAFEAAESVAYYTTEALAIVAELACHPSFVMLTFGNELHADKTGHANMSNLLQQLRFFDNTRLYASGSNNHYGNQGTDSDSDFYTSQSWFKEWLRGTSAGHANPEIDWFSKSDGHSQSLTGYINRRYPDTTMNYQKAFAGLREVFSGPVYSFEVGQYEVLPDFSEMSQFEGNVTRPDNFQVIYEEVAAKGLLDHWEDYVAATGEMALLAYREEVEASMRTPAMSGISLLGIQDFPGQGTALVGMLNSHLEAKPFEFAKPEHFAAFFKDVLPLALLPGYTYTAGSQVEGSVLVANFGKVDLQTAVEIQLSWDSSVDDGEQTSESQKVSLPMVPCPAGSQTEVGQFVFNLPRVKKAVKAQLSLTIAGHENHYSLWIYPKVQPICPENVYETRCLDEKALAVLATGGRVFLAPDADPKALPQSIQTQFTPDFWSAGTFSMQPGGMGQYIAKEHPLFTDFPTDSHSDWQWWAMASTRAAILPTTYDSIITELDSYAYLRPMAKLIEFNVGGGRLLFSTMGLHQLQDHVEARGLLSSIYRYMASEDFVPKQEISVVALGEMVVPLTED